MSTWNRLHVARAARRNAALGIAPAVETVVSAILGPRPSLTTNNLRHAKFVRNLRPSTQAEDWREDLRASEEAYTAYFSPLVYLLGIFLVGITDFASATKVIGDMGLPKGERLCFGFALAFGLIMLTAAVTRRAEGNVSGAALWARRVGLILLCIVFGGVVLALAASRTEVIGDQSLLSAKVVPQLAIMSVITVGPAFAFEYLIARFVESRRIRRGIRRLRHEQRGEERRRREAERFTDRRAVESELFDQEATQLRAIYEVEYARQAAVRRPERLLPALPLAEGATDEST